MAEAGLQKKVKRRRRMMMKEEDEDDVCLSVTPAVSGVRGADEQQKTKFGPTYSVRLLL